MVLWQSRGDDKWRKRPMRLPQNHGWRASPGNSVFVANRGEVIFEFPIKWVITPIEDGSIRISDREPPKESMRIDVISFEFAPHLSTSATLEAMLNDLANEEQPREMISRGPIQEMYRPDFEVAWLQGDFIDSDENRKAHMRLCLARRGNLYAHITSDFYPEVARPAIKAWNRMLATLKIGERIRDPALRSRMN